MNNFFASVIGSVVTVTYSFEIQEDEVSSSIQKLVKADFADDSSKGDRALKWGINLDSLRLDSGNSGQQILLIKVKFSVNSKINEVDIESIIMDKANEVKIKIQSMITGTYKSSAVTIDTSREKDLKYLSGILVSIVFTVFFWYIVAPRDVWNNWVALMLFWLIIIIWIYISGQTKIKKIWSDNLIPKFFKISMIIWLFIWRFAICALIFWLVVSNYPENV